MLRAVSPALAIVLMVAAASAPLRADTYPRQPGIKIANYTFDIGVSDANNEFTVQATVDVLFVAAGVANVDLDLCKFSAAPRPALGANQLPDPCAEPSGGRGGT